MERPYPITKIEVQILPREEAFLPGNYKVLAEVEIPGQKAIEDLNDSNRLKVGKKTAQVISGICPRLEPILMTVHGMREGVVNIAIYTNSLPDINTLRDAERVHLLDAYDISDPDNPEQLEEKDWLKR